MAIESNFKAFREELARQIAGAEGFEVDIDQGSEKLAQDIAPRVLFVLRAKESMTGQRLMAGGGAYGTPTPKALLCRVVGFDVHIRGTDRDQVEALISHVANAVHIGAWGAYKFNGGTWMGEADGSVNNRGNYYVLHAEMYIPITRPPQSVVFGEEPDAPLQFPTTEVISHA